VARDDRWGRTYESFGEKPELPASMATFVTGMQGQTLGGDGASVLATAKHHLGDGGTTGGVDQGDTQLPEAELRAIHLPPFQEAVRRGVGYGHGRTYGTGGGPAPGAVADPGAVRPSGPVPDSLAMRDSGSAVDETTRRALAAVPGS
jgi:beta-glucosidase-like glycosyl hydrolase